jgi:hypothetical protein
MSGTGCGSPVCAGRAGLCGLTGMELSCVPVLGPPLQPVGCPGTA